MCERDGERGVCVREREDCVCEREREMVMREREMVMREREMVMRENIISQHFKWEDVEGKRSKRLEEITSSTSF